MHGQGKFTWANGDIYEGQFADNQMHGLGEWVSEWVSETEMLG